MLACGTIVVGVWVLLGLLLLNILKNPTVPVPRSLPGGVPQGHPPRVGGGHDGHRGVQLLLVVGVRGGHSARVIDAAPTALCARVHRVQRAVGVPRKVALHALRPRPLRRFT